MNYKVGFLWSQVVWVPSICLVFGVHCVWDTTRKSFPGSAPPLHGLGMLVCSFIKSSAWGTSRKRRPWGEDPVLSCVWRGEYARSWRNRHRGAGDVSSGFIPEVTVWLHSTGLLFILWGTSPSAVVEGSSSHLLFRREPFLREVSSPEVPSGHSVNPREHQNPHSGCRELEAQFSAHRRNRWNGTTEQ